MVDININLTVSGHEKLLDYLASGIGATAGPLLAAFAPWRASQEGKARVITAKVDAEVRQIQATTINSMSQLIAKEQAEAREYVVPDKLEPDRNVQVGSNDVKNAMEFQAKKRLINVGAIAGHAAEELGDTEVTNHDPDPDWAARFFDGAQDISSEELQKLWGRILAGEVKSPGQTSLRTLSILRNMTQREAKDFSNLMRFRIVTFIFNKGVQKILGEDSINLTTHFIDIGLLRSFGTSPNLIIQNDGALIQKHCDYLFRIQGQPGQQLNKLTAYNTSLITSSGLELAELCRHQEPDLLYLSYFATLLAEQNCKLSIRKIMYQNDQEIQLSDIRIIEPFVEPEERDQ